MKSARSWMLLATSCSLAIMGCKKPLEIPAGYPREFQVFGADQCASSGSAYAYPVGVFYANYAGGPVVNAEVTITLSGATVAAHRELVRPTDNSGMISLDLRADSLVTEVGPSADVTVHFRANDKPYVEASATLTVSHQAWGGLVAPVLPLPCAQGDRLLLPIDVLVIGNCGNTPNLPNALDVLVDDQSIGVLRMIGRLDPDQTGSPHYTHAGINFDLSHREGVFTVLIRDKDARMRNTISFSIQQCP